ncbi:hypothetical protein [Streptomyces prasinus]|uniref:hypothetical protein n=1 Tax=Streptomyces prasinus TaxID=67345 RepID=UPI0033A4EF0E
MNEKPSYAALLAEVQHLRGQQSKDDDEYAQATAEIQRLKDRVAELEADRAEEAAS